MTDTRLTHEDIQAVKKYIAATSFTHCLIITIWAVNSTRFILDKETFESIKMFVRVITYGGLAGTFLGSASGAAGVNIADKLNILKNSPDGGRLRRRFMGRGIADVVFIAVSTLCTYLLRADKGPSGVILAAYAVSYIVTLAAKFLLYKKAVNSIDRMDI